MYIVYYSNFFYHVYPKSDLNDLGSKYIHKKTNITFGKGYTKTVNSIEELFEKNDLVRVQTPDSDKITIYNSSINKSDVTEFYKSLTSKTIKIAYKENGVWKLL